MRKCITILLLAISFQVAAQSYPVTSINISLPANPDANTANWGSGTSMLTISASASPVNGRPDASVMDSKILVIIKKNGVKVCGNYTINTAPTSNFSTLSKVWSGNNAVSLMGQNVTLVPGDYEICVQFFAYKYGGNIPLSDEKTKPFTIVAAGQQSYMAPQTIQPINFNLFTEASLKNPLTFRWSPVLPNPTGIVTYRLKIWQLTQGQTGAQAMIANQPIVDNNYNNITQVIIQNLVSGPLTPPYLNDFIWIVQATKAGIPIGDNNGTSAPSVFNAGTIAPNPPGSNTATQGCATTSTQSFVTGDFISLSDDFKMTFTEAPTGSNDSLTGKGTVLVKWLGLLNVKFKGIKINGQNKLCAGSIFTNSDSTQVYPTQWAVNSTNNSSWGAWTIGKIKAVCAGIRTNKVTKPLVKASNFVDNTLLSTPLNMPLGYFKANDTTTSIGFTEMVFNPEYAEFEVIASLPTKGVFKHANTNGTDVIALRGSGIHFKNSGLKEISGSIKLLDPIVFSFATGTEYIKLKFNSESSGHLGNGVVFSSVNDEFWKYDFDVNVELPKEWLIPADTTKTNVDVNFQMEIAEWSDFVLQGNLPACVIPNSNGIGIEAGVIIYDHSSIVNAPGMVFPDDYAGDTNDMFSGFYLKNFKITLPDQLRSYADTTKKIELAVENLIIDEYGVTGKILASNILNYPKANIGNLGASIDTFKLSLVSSVLTEAILLGKITLPLSSSDEISNAINYSAIFQSDPGVSSSITFALMPGQDIKSKFLGDGKIQIDQTSSLNLILSNTNANGRDIQLDIDLNGKLYYPTGKIIDPGSTIPLDLDLSCNFEHLGMTYKKSGEETFTLNTGHWSFASPQKKFSGFSFNITEVKPKIEPIGAGAEKQYLFKGGVQFVAKINIGSENSKIGISGDTKITLTGAIESSKYIESGTPWPTTGGSGTQLTNSQIQSNLTTIGKNQSQLISNSSYTPSGLASNVKKDWGYLTQLKPVYLGVFVESIHVDAHMPALTIKGNVDFYKRDVVYGNGFKGDLTAKFTTLNLAVQAGAIFGNTKYIPNNTVAGFKYWMVQAQVNLPPPGIVFMTGIAFRGFGAGVYSRMNMTPPATFNPATASSSTFGGANFTPAYAIEMGYKVKAIISTTPKEETFNGSIALAAEFNTNGGMNFIQIDGLANCGAKIGEEVKAFANGSLSIKYDFPLKKFSTNLLLTINKDPISTPSGPINSHFYIDGMKNEWAFTCGIPPTSSNPNSLNTIRLFNAVNVSEYLMFGNKIVAPTGFMPPTVAGFAGVGIALPGYAQTSISDESKAAKGFAFGVGVFTSDSRQYEILRIKNVGACGINYTYNIGSEINASLMQYQNCPGFGEGWRIKAGIALFASMNGNGYADLFGTHYEKTLLTLGFGTYAYAEFPRPFYAEGVVHGDVEVGGKSFGFDASFKTGERCEGTSVDIPAGQVYTQEDAEESLNCTLINSIVTPGGSTGVSRTTTFAALLNYRDGEVFDLQEQQASGQMNVRTFRAVYTPVLTQDSASTGTTLNTQLNSQALAANIPSGTGSPVNSSGATALAKKTTMPSSGLQKQNATALTSATTPSNSIALSASGYDALGARIFRLKKTGLLVNPLKPNTSYKFKLTARLEEKINNNWTVVKNPTTNAPIVRTKQMYFRTNSATVGTGTTLNNSSKAAIHL